MGRGTRRSTASRAPPARARARPAARRAARRRRPPRARRGTHIRRQRVRGRSRCAPRDSGRKGDRARARSAPDRRRPPGRARRLESGERRRRAAPRPFRELVNRVHGDQAERAIHSLFLSSSGRETLIGANGAACFERRPPLPCGTRAARGTRRPGRRAAGPDLGVEDRSAGGGSAARGSARGTGDNGREPKRHVGERDLRAATASRQSVAASCSGSCGASLRSGGGAGGAGPTLGRSGGARLQAGLRAIRPPPSSGGTRRAAARAPRQPPPARARRARPPRRGRARGPSARAARDQDEELATSLEIELSRPASRSTKAITIAAMSTSAGSSSSFSRSVRSRSKGPSKASRSSSSSPTAVTPRKLARGSDAAARDGHRLRRLGLGASAALGPATAQELPPDEEEDREDEQHVETQALTRKPSDLLGRIDAQASRGRSGSRCRARRRARRAQAAGSGSGGRQRAESRRQAGSRAPRRGTSGGTSRRTVPVGPAAGSISSPHGRSVGLPKSSWFHQLPMRPIACATSRPGAAASRSTGTFAPARRATRPPTSTPPANPPQMPRPPSQTANGPHHSSGTSFQLVARGRAARRRCRRRRPRRRPEDQIPVAAACTQRCRSDDAGGDRRQQHQPVHVDRHGAEVDRAGRGEGIEARSITGQDSDRTRTRVLEQDLSGELGRAAGPQEVGRVVQVDVEPGGDGATRRPGSNPARATPQSATE